MSLQLEKDVLSAVQQYSHAATWKEWGLTYLRQQGSAILLYGNPGTGKTVIAHYLASLVKKPLVELGMADIGGGKPGDTERAARQVFMDAAHGKKTVFIDEADAILYKRSTIVGESKYMIGVIDELLKLIAKHKGLTILATNMPETLDEALDRRLIAKVEVPHPELPERIKLWTQKWPKAYPLKLTAVQFESLAEIPLTGAEIENVIIRESSYAIMEKRKPTFESICNVAKTEYKAKHQKIT